MNVSLPTKNLIKFEALRESLARFGISHFRKGQAEVLSAVLAAKDTVAVLPTGAGKSLCYQLPAVHLQAPVLVVSPLVALMRDQVSKLSSLGLASGCLYADQSPREREKVLADRCHKSNFILFVSPERVQMDALRPIIERERFCLFAIDEAHCISHWGHDFRQEYSQLGLLRTLRPEVPLLALTASATPWIVQDIGRELRLRDPVNICTGFFRKNLFYQIEHCQSATDRLLWLRAAITKFKDGRILVYCGTRSTAEGLRDVLSQTFDQVGFYHAGLSIPTRLKIQDDFTSGRIRILTTTNAFGMGVDLPDVRCVVHYNLPGSLDALYQEMGRAGRDGKASTCLLLYAAKDKGLQYHFIERSVAPQNIKKQKMKFLQSLVNHATREQCRHLSIMKYYHSSEELAEFPKEGCGHCDHCAPQSPMRIQEHRGFRQLPLHLTSRHL